MSAGNGRIWRLIPDGGIVSRLVASQPVNRAKTGQNQANIGKITENP